MAEDLPAGQEPADFTVVPVTRQGPDAAALQAPEIDPFCAVGGKV